MIKKGFAVVAALFLMSWSLEAEDKTVDAFFSCSNWATITPSCGNTYHLCTDNYSNLGEFMNAVAYFNSVKCPQQ